ncbi:MAG: hypothetical protein ACR2JV_01735 [Gaiellales bacterium]
MDDVHDPAAEATPTAFARLRAFAEANALWIQIAIGVIAWIALLLAFPLVSTTPIYARY